MTGLDVYADRVIFSCAVQEFTALGSQNQIGKTVGSFADATFDFSTASPVVSFVLNQPARRLVVAVVNLDTKISYP